MQTGCEQPGGYPDIHGGEQGFGEMGITAQVVPQGGHERHEGVGFSFLKGKFADLLLEI
jgi:hypothetical protein